jgi:autotransporter family porin
VRRGQPEIRPNNTPYNNTPGSASAPQWPRVTGNFTGTTDEIIQWGACKWGFDENTLRAQAAKESYWSMLSVGDNGESFGIMQVRSTTFRNNGVFPNAQSSTAFNIDIYLATWRDCLDGKDTWLNTVERGGQYGPGDAWGCIGKWFSGRWYTQPSVDYIHAVQDYLNQQIWLDGGFQAWRP